MVLVKFECWHGWVHHINSVQFSSVPYGSVEFWFHLIICFCLFFFFFGYMRGRLISRGSILSMKCAQKNVNFINEGRHGCVNVNHRSSIVEMFLSLNLFNRSNKDDILFIESIPGSAMSTWSWTDFWTTFHCNFIYSPIYCRKTAKRKSKN